MSAAVFLLIPPSLSRGLRVVKAGRSCQNRWLWAPDLRFFRLGVLCYLGLGTGLGRSSVHRLIALVAVLIGVTADESLYFGLSLSFRGFLNQSALTVQLSAFFIDPQPNWWPQTFVKVSAQNFFGWGILSVKFSQYGLELYQVRSPILHFFLMILGVLFNSAPDAVYKRGWFSETLSMKDLKFVPSERVNPVLFF